MFCKDKKGGAAISGLLVVVNGKALVDVEMLALILVGAY